MKRIIYTNKADNQIISYEAYMLEQYAEFAKKYTVFFEEKGYSLKMGLMWNYFPSNTVIFQRGSFRNGYQCYVYCAVQKDGKDVHISSSDGEADYYSLSTAWLISSICRKFCKLNAIFYENMDDIDEKLEQFLSHLNDAKDIE